MFFKFKALLVFVTFVWSVVIFSDNVLSGSTWSFIPLAGSLLLSWYFIKLFLFIGKNADKLNKLVNALTNITFLLQEKSKTQPEEFKKMREMFSVDPKKFEQNFY